MDYTMTTRKQSINKQVAILRMFDDTFIQADVVLESIQERCAYCVRFMESCITKGTVCATCPIYQFAGGGCYTLDTWHAMLKAETTPELRVHYISWLKQVGLYQDTMETYNRNYISR